MASDWTYSDWIEQSDRATRLDRLRKHIREVSDAITARTASGGTTYDPAPLREYHQQLLEQERQLAASAGPRFTRGRPA